MMINKFASSAPPGIISMPEPFANLSIPTVKLTTLQLVPALPATQALESSKILVFQESPVIPIATNSMEVSA